MSYIVGRWTDGFVTFDLHDTKCVTFVIVMSCEPT